MKLSDHKIEIDGTSPMKPQFCFKQVETHYGDTNTSYPLVLQKVRVLEFRVTEFNLWNNYFISLLSCIMNYLQYFKHGDI